MITQGQMYKEIKIPIRSSLSNGVLDGIVMAFSEEYELSEYGKVWLNEESFVKQGKILDLDECYFKDLVVDGRELHYTENARQVCQYGTLAEIWEYKLPRSVIKVKEGWAIVSLQRMTRLEGEDIGNCLVDLRKGRNLYRKLYIKKSNGGKREIFAPNESLKKIQKALNKSVLAYLSAEENVYGFSGGSIKDAVLPHVKSKIIFCVDFVDAFQSVKKEHIEWLFLTDMGSYYIKGDGFHFSWHMSKVLIDLVTFGGKLPQGAPTSPRLFDLVCKDIDRRLNRIAKNVGGTYTRFADNIMFSLPHEEFPRKLKMAILRIINGGSRSPYFNTHKLKIRKIERGAIRILGLNIIEGKIHNSRKFKRKIRFLIYHVSWLLEKGFPFERPWLELQGHMAFAIKEALPRKLIEEFEVLEDKVNSEL